MFLAAGLSFFFLVCLVPMLFLFVSVAGYLLSSEAATGAILSQLSQIVPVYKKELSELLSRMIAARQMSGVLGSVILLFFSIQLFACLRMVMNVVFAERKGRGFVHGMIWDVVMLMVIGILFVASTFITDLFFWLRTFVLAAFLGVLPSTLAATPSTLPNSIASATGASRRTSAPKVIQARVQALGASQHWGAMHDRCGVQLQLDPEMVPAEAGTHA